jgi:hypothetical protein
VLRKYVLALSIAALPVAAVAASTTAANASVRPHKAITFTGSVNCALAGAIKATPAITNTASKGTIAIKLSGKLTKCTGSIKQGGLTISKGTVSSTATLPAGTTCSSLLSSLPKPIGKISWTPTVTGGNTIKPTAFALSSPKLASESPITIDYTSTQTGSFTGKGAAKAVIKQGIATLLNDCGGTGVSILTITTGSTVS